MVGRQYERKRRGLGLGLYRGLVGIRRMDNVTNVQIKQLCGVTKGLDEKIDENVHRWFGHVERMENDRIRGAYL